MRDTPATKASDTTPQGDTAEDTQHRKILYLVLASTFVGCVVMLIFDALNTGLDMTTPSELATMQSGILIAMAGVFVTYVVARWVSLDLASAFFVVMLIGVTAISDTPEQVTQGRSLMTFAVPILLAGLLLPPWTTFVAALLSSLVILGVGSTIGRPLPNIPATITFLFMALIAYLFAHNMKVANQKLHHALTDLAAREADFRLMFDGNPLPMCVARVSDARLLAVNEAAVRHYGYTREEFLTLLVSDILLASPDRPDANRDLPMQWPYTAEQRHRVKDGTIMDALVTAHRVSVFGDDAILVVAQDITERKRAEAQLELMSRVVDESPASTVIMDLTGTIEYVNHRFEQLTGFSTSDMRGRTWEALRPQEASPEIGQEIMETILQGKVWHTEFEAVRKDGGPLRMTLSICGVHNSTGALTHYLSVAEDITARHAAEQALRTLNNELEQRVAQRTTELERANRELARSARMKDEFLATMSHELRTPLTGILGGADALSEEIYGALNPRQARAVGLIRESGDQLLAVINSILDLSKIEAGGVALAHERFSVADVCTASLHLVSTHARSMEHTISYTCIPHDATVMADPGRLKQILVNLLTNAIKFTPKGGRIRLEVQADAENEQIVFAVSDNGIGIAAEDLPRLFQPFVQLDSGLNRVYGGTGLGLALVRRLAEMHGGGVGVDSTLGQGSRFWVALPWSPGAGSPLAARDPAIEAPTAPTLQGILPQRPLILLAEDSPASVQIVVDCLQPAGCQVIVVSNGEDAVQSVLSRRPDLVLMDIQMPRLDGIGAIRQLRGHADPAIAHLPIVALTALAMVGDRERCLAAGANAYLSKPFTVRALLSTIQQLLGSDAPALPGSAGVSPACAGRLMPPQQPGAPAQNAPAHSPP